VLAVAEDQFLHQPKRHTVVTADDHVVAVAVPVGAQRYGGHSAIVASPPTVAEDLRTDKSRRQGHDFSKPDSLYTTGTQPVSDESPRRGDFGAPRSGDDPVAARPKPGGRFAARTQSCPSIIEHGGRREVRCGAHVIEEPTRGRFS